MRVVLGIERYSPATGGAENYIRSIAHGLSQKHEVTVVAFTRDDRPQSLAWRCLFERMPGRCDDGPVRVVRPFLSLVDRMRLSPALLQAIPLPGDAVYRRLREMTFRRFARVLQPHLVEIFRGADVIHTVAPWEISRAAALAAKHCQIPHIITGLMHPGYWADDENSVQLFRAASTIIALANVEKESYCAVGVEPDRVRQIGVPAPPPNVCHPALFSRSYAVGSSMILFVGAKRWYKGCDLLLKCAPLVWRRFPEATFVFIGPPTEEWRRMSAHAADARIIDLGWVPDDLRDAALAAADVICLPSRTEIMPNAVLEAWAAGKPVVVSDIPAFRELVSGAGLTAPLEPVGFSEALIALLDNPKLASSLGAEGFRRIREDYSRDRIVGALEELYVASR